MSQLNKTVDNGRIAKNTFFLYVRMLLTVGVGLFTSRIILNALGAQDYGVYNVVGGVVFMLAFLNSGMVAATQRFLSFELGSENEKNLKSVFCTAITTHLFIGVLILFVAETFGLWFVNARMNIPAERLCAANWVYQCSVITFFVSVISVPYNSCLVAHERLNVYAYVSIFEAFAKLGIAVFLFFSSVDKLIWYAILVLCVQIAIRFVYGFYCKKHFSECVYKFSFDKTLFRKMLSFAGWSMFGNLGFSFKDQGSNIILNLFCGPTVNAARGIAVQVSGYINSFANNFAIAMTPQITKQYAAGNLEISQRLVYSGSRYSFLLMAMIVVPFVVNVDEILTMWLGSVPQYTSVFVILTLISSLMYVVTQPVTNAIQATGKIRLFQILLTILLLSELPMAYIILNCGAKPYMAMFPTLVTSFCAIYLRIILLKKMIPSYSIKIYTVGTIMRCFSLFGVCVALAVIVKKYLCGESIFVVALNCLISFSLTVCIEVFVGLNSDERKIAFSKIKKMFGRGVKK